MKLLVSQRNKNKIGFGCHRGYHVGRHSEICLKLIAQDGYDLDLQSYLLKTYSSG